MPRHRRHAALLAIVLAGALTGCASTVQITSTSTTTAAGSGAVSGQVGQAAGSLAPESASSGAAGSGASALAPGAGGATHAGGTRATGPGTSTAQPGVMAPRGRGWDEKYVYVGVVTQKDTQQVFASFGADNVDPGDTERQAQAAADAVNARGGVLGRQVRIRFQDIHILEAAQDAPGVGERVCTHFTQDAPVIAVWNVSTQIDQAPTFRGCLAKARIPLFSTAARAVDDQMFAQLTPYYYHSIMVSWTRLAPVLVGRLKAQGWFGGWDTTLGRPGSAPVAVGILIQDQPQGHRTATSLQRALAAAGYRNVVTFAYTDPSQGQASSVQKFKGSNVTHVIVTDVEMTAFQQAASSQAYKPRYGITTYNDPYSNLESSGFTPTGANNGAMGVGWAPTFDVSESNDPGATPGWGRCRTAMAKQGQSFGAKRLAQAYASTLCDTFLLIQAAAEAGHGFTGLALGAGVAHVGSVFPVAIGFRAALRGSAPYAPGEVRDLAWDTSCSCMRYGKGRAAV